jgi:2-dehydropantoate 2-reductase
MHSAGAIASVAHLAREGTWALTLQNGLGNAEAIAEVFGPERVLMGVTDYPADLQGLTQVASHGAGRISIGAFRQTSAADQEAERVADLFTRCGLDARFDPAVLGAIWEKVAFNAALNSISTITGLPVGGMDRPEGRRIARAVIDEVAAVASAKGIRLDSETIWHKVEFALANHRSHKPSMLQDRLAGRRTEIESINGAIVRTAESLGVPSPVTSTLADLVRMTERDA